MLYSPLTIHLTKCDAVPGDRPEVSEPAIATVLPADLKNEEEFDFDKTDVIA